MGSAAVSVFASSIDLVVLGLTLVAARNVLSIPFGFPETSEVRVVGTLVRILGSYDATTATWTLLALRADRATR